MQKTSTHSPECTRAYESYTCADKVMETLREEKMFDNAILLQEIEPTQTGMHAIYGYCFI